MRIKAEQVKKLRKERHWSQEQLATACGVNLRTIQRLENTGKVSTESVRALAAVFEVDADSLVLSTPDDVATPLNAIRTGFMKATDFSGRATRFEYWWFFLFVFMLGATAAVIDDKLLQVVSLPVLLPLIAAGTRRLRDTGHSGWWQLLFLVPFGQVVVLYLLALKGQSDSDQPNTNHANAV